MKIERRLIDDLKTERPDVTPCLPAYFRIVPILFYLIVLGGILLSGVFFFLLTHSVKVKDEESAETAKHKQSLAELQKERQAIELQTRRASTIVAWIEGARGIQPLIVSIIRSMESESSIAELALSRDPATPTQIKIKLKLNTQGVRQLDATLEKIAMLNFRAYNPNQLQTKGAIDYEATLIYQGASSIPPAPTPAATPK